MSYIYDEIGLPPTVKCVRRDLFTVPEGTAILELPCEISQQSSQEILEWIDLVTRRIRREADKKSETQQVV